MVTLRFVCYITEHWVGDGGRARLEAWDQLKDVCTSAERGEGVGGGEQMESTMVTNTRAQKEGLEISTLE